jgi:hypothetical protein
MITDGAFTGNVERAADRWANWAIPDFFSFAEIAGNGLKPFPAVDAATSLPRALKREG